MLIEFLFVLMTSAVLGGCVEEERRRTFYQRFRGKLMPRPQKLKNAPGLDISGDVTIPQHVITTTTDFNHVPNNLTDLELVFEEGHRVQFVRGMLPADLGGPHLEHLYMTVTYAPNGTIPEGLFINLGGLRTLQLYHEGADWERFSLTLSEGAFDGLSQLDELALAQLGLRNLPAGLFRGLTSICSLDLSHNRLSVIGPDVFGQLSGLGGSRLLALELGRNQFVDVADIQLKGLQNLRSVDLYGNNIARLDRNSFGAWFGSVEELNLDLNVVDRIEQGAFERMTKLRTLWLEGCAINDTTASAFRNLSALRTLDLRANSISELRPGVFAPLRGLRKLVLTNNEVETVQMGAFFGLSDLRQLNLSGNRLRIIDDEMLRGLEALEELCVRDNLIANVTQPALAIVAGSLTALDLANNSLETVDFDGLAVAERLNSVRLADNSWVCDCRLQRSPAVGSEALKSAWDHIICQHPAAARGRFLSDVLADQSIVNCSSGTSSVTEQPTSLLPCDDDITGWTWLICVAGAAAACLVVVAVWVLVSIHRAQHSASWSPENDSVSSQSSADEHYSVKDDCRPDDGMTIVIVAEICDSKPSLEHQS